MVMLKEPQRRLATLSVTLLALLLCCLIFMVVFYERRLLRVEQQMRSDSSKCDCISAFSNAKPLSSRQSRVLTQQDLLHLLQQTASTLSMADSTGSDRVVKRSVSAQTSNVSDLDASYNEGLRKAFVQAIDLFVSTSLRQLCVDRRRVCLPGPKGDKGDEGYQGRPGSVGELGATGRGGTPGRPGKVGPKGERGDEGQLGDKGSRGERGMIGQKGSKGDNGIMGLPGMKGQQGSKGDRGGTGDSGFMLPRACSSKQITTLTNVKRKISVPRKGSSYRCDSGSQSDFEPGEWHRFADNVGVRMPETCSPLDTCGTAATGWLKGGHPSLIGQEVSRVVCFSYNMNGK